MPGLALALAAASDDNPGGAKRTHPPPSPAEGPPRHRMPGHLRSGSGWLRWRGTQPWDRPVAALPLAFLQGLMDPERPPREDGMEVHIPILPDATPGIEKGGSLVSSILGDPRLICGAGSGGRPGLSTARRGERSEPERAVESGRWSDREVAGRKGPCRSLVATVLPQVLNGYLSIKARTTSTGEGKNT